MIYEDERRILEGWAEAKIITAKQDCLLGDHYHLVKTERFVLTKGIGAVVIDGEEHEMEIGDLITISPMVRHAFILQKGSVLIGLCSHPYDHTDDYK